MENCCKITAHRCQIKSGRWERKKKVEKILESLKGKHFFYVVEQRAVLCWETTRATLNASNKTEREKAKSWNGEEKFPGKIYVFRCFLSPLKDLYKRAEEKFENLPFSCLPGDRNDSCFLRLKLIWFDFFAFLYEHFLSVLLGWFRGLGWNRQWCSFIDKIFWF